MMMMMMMMMAIVVMDRLIKAYLKVDDDNDQFC
jgi:hypothetical protein